MCFHLFLTGSWSAHRKCSHDVWTKWLTLCRRHIRTYFLENYLNIVIKIVVLLAVSIQTMTSGEISGDVTVHWQYGCITYSHSLKPNWPINSLAPGKFEWNFSYVIFKRILVIDGWDISCEIFLLWISMDLKWRSVNIGSGNGLVPSGNKPLPEPMLTQISLVTRPQWVKRVPAWVGLFISVQAYAMNDKVSFGTYIHKQLYVFSNMSSNTHLLWIIFIVYYNCTYTRIIYTWDVI